MPGYAVNEANRIQNAAFAGQAYTAPAGHSLSLHTAEPGNSDAPTSEFTGAGYTRQNVTFGTAANGQVANTGIVTFPNLPALTAAFLAVWNTVVGGAGSVPQVRGALGTPVALSVGQSVTFAAGSITDALGV